MARTPYLSIIIPTLDRPESLEQCLESLKAQTEQNYEVIIEREKGPLARIRNIGLHRARGEVVSFIDDDVILGKEWVRSVLDTIRPAQILGVTGPAIIPESSKKMRDLFRWPWLKYLHDELFIERQKRQVPGHISNAGSFTTASSESSNSYEGLVEYLEACNMSFKAEPVRAVGGFDEQFGGIGDWSEPDLCFRLRKANPDKILWYSQKIRLQHCPSRTGAFLLRKHTGARLKNYDLFCRRWVRPCLKNMTYKMFLRAYYGMKEIRALFP